MNIMSAVNTCYLLKIIQVERKRSGFNLKNSSGFTTIELLITVLILSVGIVAYAGFYGNIVGMNSASKRESIAVSWAQEKLEELKNESLDEALDSGHDGSDLMDGYYNRAWSVTNGGEGNLTTFQVTVSWQDVPPGSVTLSTLLSQ
jgi:type IV pilus assembly protein PilV